MDTSEFLLRSLSGLAAFCIGVGVVVFIGGEFPWSLLADEIGTSWCDRFGHPQSRVVLSERRDGTLFCKTCGRRIAK